MRPGTSELLTTGGDARIKTDPLTGANTYHCAPFPDASLLAYGSATASTISHAAFAAVDSLRAALESGATTHDSEMQRIKTELTIMLGLENNPIIFAPSGTDVFSAATQLVSHAEPVLILMMEACETGSGVPAALGGKATHVVAIPSRNSDGSLRPLGQVDEEFTRRATDALSGGRQVMVVLTDTSKTGLVIPSTTCVSGLRQRFTQLQVLVDACQFRLCPATLNGYLKQGFMVAITGSKFMTGPAFSGALLVPAALATQFSLPPLSPNTGLLLRWQAALTQMQLFYVLPESRVTSFTRDFAVAMQAAIHHHQGLEVLGVHPLSREKYGWDSIQTIFPFLLKHADGGTFDRAHTHELYLRLRREANIELGQPVKCGERNGIPISALRLCLSARLITDALTGRGEEVVIQEALGVISTIASFISS